MVQHSQIDHTGLTGVGGSFASNVNRVDVANYGGAASTVTRGDHVHLGVTSISHTSNTFSGPVTLVAAGTLGITSPSSGTFALSATGAGGGGAAASSFPTTAYAACSADVTLSSADTPTDVTGASITLGAGTWDITAIVSFHGVAGNSYALAFIVSGASTAVSSGRTYVPANEYQTVPLAVRVTPGGSTTYKLRAQMGGTTNKVKQFVDGNTIATLIRAIQVA